MKPDTGVAGPGQGTIWRWVDQASILAIGGGEMKVPNPGSLWAAAGFSAAVGIGVAQLELTGHPESDIWSSRWLIGGLVIAGLLIVIIIAGPVIDHVRHRTVTPSASGVPSPNCSERIGIQMKDTKLELERAKIANQNIGIDVQGGRFSGTDITIE
jgi:hypothetical protein